MIHEEKVMTKGGNPRAAPMAIYLHWIVEAWESLSKELIIKSFKSCGIINATDGSEDDSIHCFKSEGSVLSGRARLKRAREEKKLIELLEEIDLEEEKENEEYDSDISLE